MGRGIYVRKGVALGLSIACFTAYGLGSVLVGDTNQSWPWYRVAVVSAAVAAVTGLGLTLWAALCKSMFEKSQKRVDWRNEFDACAKISTLGVAILVVATLTIQLVLVKLLYCPKESLLWAITFAIVSTVIAAAGTYYFIGYPGMANLELIDERLREAASAGGRPGRLPENLRSSLEAELAMLRTMMAGLIVVYIAPIPTLLLGLDKASVLLGLEDSSFTRVPFGTKMWFAAGVVLLLAGCHATVSSAVYGRHSQIARWLRHAPLGGTYTDAPGAAPAPD